MRVQRHPDADSFLAHARDWLLAAEAEHNLMLGLAERLRTGDHPYQDPIYLATVSHAGEVAGCAMRTPPHKLLLTRMPEEGVVPLIEDVAALYQSIPGILGPEPLARLCAEEWCRRQGGTAQRGMQQRIYLMERLIAPERSAPGQLRVATPADQDLITRWCDGFIRDTGIPEIAPGLVEGLIAKQQLFVWQDGEPRSIVAGVGRTTNGIRITFVYTPPEFRGKGYASCCVAALSGRYLAEGLRFCFLYTDLSNPTSNSIYSRIGYQPVCDVVDYDFE